MSDQNNTVHEVGAPNHSEQSDIPVSADVFSTAVNPNGFPAAGADVQTDATDSDYTYTHEFKMPIIYMGQAYSKLTFDWGKLTGEDSLIIEAELQALGKPVIVASLSGEYIIRMAVRAADAPIGVDIFKRMSIFDFNKIRNAGRAFLLKAE